MDIAKESKRGSGTTVRGHWSLTSSSGKTSSTWGAVCSLRRLLVSAIDECWVSEKRKVQGAVGSEEKMGCRVP